MDSGGSGGQAIVQALPVLKATQRAGVGLEETDFCCRGHLEGRKGLTRNRVGETRVRLTRVMFVQIVHKIKVKYFWYVW